LENTGRYAWPVDSRAPRGVYIRVEARDEAGNVGQCESGQCVALDHSRPGVRIRDVRPLGESAQTPRHYYFR
jgi:hypothetical protein